MRKHSVGVAMLLLFASVVSNPLNAQTTPQSGSIRGANPVDPMTMPRPIDIHDSVWMADLTALEVRDLIKAGKTTALLMGGGVEENGPYMVLDKHNIVSRAMGEAIARRLGNTLVAPIIPIEPGNPEKPPTPGAPELSHETYQAVLRDMATSLRAMGFKDIVMLGDNGGNLKDMSEVTTALNAKWKGQGARVHFIEKYGSSGPDSGCCGFGVVSAFKEEKLGIKEEMGKDGLHDNYYIEAMVMTQTLDGVRIPERIKAGKTTINGVSVLPVEKTVENGKKMIAHRADQTAKEIRRLMAASTGSR